MNDRIPIRRALASVYDKSDLDDLVRGLVEAGVELVSTGGSAARIASLGLPTVIVQEGGYLTEHLSDNLAMFLAAYEGAHVIAEPEESPAEQAPEAESGDLPGDHQEPDV